MSESHDDRVVPFEFWTFAGIGAFFVVLGTIYWFTSYEPAGTTMLLLCAGLGALGMWVSRPNRPGDVPVGDGSVPEPGHAVESSLWPLIVGLGLMLVANGFVLGLWLLVPGAALVLRGLVGMLTERPADQR
jgi:hypothetical protein